MQANILKSGLRGIGSRSPLSVKTTEELGDATKEDKHSNVSGEARLTSSNKIQSPRLKAVTKGPST